MWSEMLRRLLRVARLILAEPERPQHGLSTMEKLSLHFCVILFCKLSFHLGLHVVNRNLSETYFLTCGIRNSRDAAHACLAWGRSGLFRTRLCPGEVPLALCPLFQKGEVRHLRLTGFQGPVLLTVTTGPAPVELATLAVPLGPHLWIQSTTDWKYFFKLRLYWTCTDFFPYQPLNHAVEQLFL